MYLILLLKHKTNGQQIWKEFNDADDFLDEYGLLESEYRLIHVIFQEKKLEGFNCWTQIFKKING